MRDLSHRVRHAATLHVTPDRAWAAVRAFGRVADWHPIASASRVVEETGHAPGAVRELDLAGGGTVRERLLLLDDAARRLAYAMVTFPIPVTAQENTVEVGPGDRPGQAHVGFTAAFAPAAGHAPEEVGALNLAAFRMAAEGLARHLGATGATGPSAPPRVLVLGATGKVGGGVARALAARGDLEVVAGVRSPARAGGLPPGVAARHLDLDDPATLPAALDGVERVLLLTGYSVDMLRQSKRFLDAAKAAGVRHVVHVGASGAATNEVAHWGWHQLVEAYVEARGFSWTHLRPEAFMQNVAAFGWLRGGVLADHVGGARWSWVDCADVAAIAAEALADPGRHAGMAYRLGTEAASLDEVAAMLTAGLGLPVRVERVAPERFYEAAVAGGGDPAYLACVRDQLRLNAAAAIPGADETFDTVRAVTGRDPVGWAGFVRREAGTLRALALAGT